MGPSYGKNENDLFYHKLDAKYFHVKQYFRKKLYFLKELIETAKNCFGSAFDHLLRKGGVLHKKLM